MHMRARMWDHIRDHTKTAMTSLTSKLEAVVVALARMNATLIASQIGLSETKSDLSETKVRGLLPHVA